MISSKVYMKEERKDVNPGVCGLCVQQYLGTQLTVFSYSTSDTFRAAAEAVGRELEAKYQVIMEEVKDEAGPLLQQLQVTAFRARCPEVS